MEHPHIRVTTRTVVDGKTSEQIIELGEPPRRFSILGPAELAALATLNPKSALKAPETNGDEPDMVPGDAQDMAEALAKVSAELGCGNNLDDMLHAIDGLRAGAPAKLEWSGTLCDGEEVTYAKAEAACAALGEGWRLPTRQELESILDLSRYNPAIDTARFPDTKSGWYWTSTPCAWSSDRAWCVGFYGGGVGYNHRDSANALARAVRVVPAGQ
jgi:hypothetical protein